MRRLYIDTDEARSDVNQGIGLGWTEVQTPAISAGPAVIGLEGWDELLSSQRGLAEWPSQGRAITVLLETSGSVQALSTFGPAFQACPSSTGGPWGAAQPNRFGNSRAIASMLVRDERALEAVLRLADLGQASIGQLATGLGLPEAHTARIVEGLRKLDLVVFAENGIVATDKARLVVAKLRAGSR